jgi:hypothetical protein
MRALLLLLPLLLVACPNEDADFDGDGVLDSQDCEAANPEVYGTAPDEAGDDVDQNCDGVDGVDGDRDG